jgi:rRNA processing protein Krr1/Pno1
VCVGASRVAVVPAAGSARSHATDSSKRPRRLYVGDVASVSLRVSEEWGPLIAAGVHASAGHIARRVIGAGGATARGIQERSGAVVGTDHEGVVTLKGSRVAVARARAAIEAILVPAATLDIATEWAAPLRDGVYASPSDLAALLLRPGAERLRTIERSSGAVVWLSKDHARVFVAGDAGAVAAARQALHYAVVPAATIDVAAVFGHLIAAGVHASMSECIRRLFGPGAARLRAVERASGASIVVAKDAARVFVCGEPAAVPRARAAIEQAVVPGDTIEVAKEWSRLLADGTHASVAAVMSRLIGPNAARLLAAELASGATIWVAKDYARVFIAGDAAAIARARAEIEQIVTPRVTIDAAAAWGRVVAAGVHASLTDVTRHLVGPGAARIRAVENATGAAAWAAKDSTRVFLSGAPPAVERARAAIEAIIVPRDTIDIALTWGPLIAGGVFASAADLARHLVGPKAERLQAVERASGAAAVWLARDRSRLFIAGDAPAARRARAALETSVTPGATIDVGAAWGPLVSAGAYASLSEVLRCALGGGEAPAAAARLASDAYVWASKDGARVFVSGSDAAVERGRAELEERLTAARVTPRGAA